MEALKADIKSILVNSNKIDWFILHKLSKRQGINSNVTFSFVDGEVRSDEPFNTNMGYLSIEDKSLYKDYLLMLLKLTMEYRNNISELANIFIIVFRSSLDNRFREKLLLELKEKLDPAVINKIYSLLVKSLNENYYSHNRSNVKKTEVLNDWLNLLQSAQYLHSISDPVEFITQLTDASNHKIDFIYIQEMSPLLRATLIGIYGWEIKVSKQKLIEIISKSEQEAVFFSACLINKSTPDGNLPSWLSADLINIFIEKYWLKIGREFILHVFGLSFRNKNNNVLFEKLREYLNSALTQKIKSDDIDNNWIRTLKFPDYFIALFNWMQLYPEVLKENITEKNQELIAFSIIKELDRIANEAPKYISSEGMSDPLKSHQLREPKYLVALSYSLLFILISKENKKNNEIEKILYKIKPLFYGGFESTAFALKFTEVIIIISLSYHNLIGTDYQMEMELEQLLKLINKTVLVPYIHLTERQSDIWETTSTEPEFQFDSGKILINIYLREIIKDPDLRTLYDTVFRAFNDVKVANWPYERD